jgi:hypothetical protein
MIFVGRRVVVNVIAAAAVERISAIAASPRACGSPRQSEIPAATPIAATIRRAKTNAAVAAPRVERLARTGATNSARFSGSQTARMSASARRP